MISWLEMQFGWLCRLAACLHCYLVAFACCACVLLAESEVRADATAHENSDRITSKANHQTIQSEHFGHWSSRRHVCEFVRMPLNKNVNFRCLDWHFENKVLNHGDCDVSFLVEMCSVIPPHTRRFTKWPNLKYQKHEKCLGESIFLQPLSNARMKAVRHSPLFFFSSFVPTTSTTFFVISKHFVLYQSVKIPS